MIYKLQLPNDNHFSNNLMLVNDNKTMETTGHKLMTFKMISQGKYTDANGQELEVTDEIIEALKNNYNTQLEMKVNEHNKLVNEGLKTGLLTADNFEDFIAMVKDHHIKLDNLIGKIYGKLWTYKSLGRLSLFCNVHVMDKLAYHNFCINLWSNTSISFNTDFNIIEYSAVTYGADERSKLMFSGENNNKINKNNLQNKILSDIIALKNKVNNDLFNAKQKKLLDKYIVQMTQDLKLKPYMGLELRECLKDVKEVDTLVGILNFIQRYIPTEKTCTTFNFIKREDK